MIARSQVVRDRKAIGQVLRDLRDRSPQRRLMVDDIIREARKPDSPLHSCFTWDAQAALEINLRREAQTLIAEFTLIVTTDEQPMVTREWVSLSSDRVHGGGWRSAQEVLSDADLAGQWHADALADLQAMQRKYAAVRALSRLMADVDKVVKKHAPPPRAKAKRGGVGAAR